MKRGTPFLEVLAVVTESDFRTFSSSFPSVQIVPGHLVMGESDQQD
jgi:hypothetical protein